MIYPECLCSQMNNSFSWFTLTMKISVSGHCQAPAALAYSYYFLYHTLYTILNFSHRESSHGKGKKGPQGSSLPEGFFDDPKLDAKARKVEYKDPMTEEWDKFQKTIQKEDDVSDH